MGEAQKSEFIQKINCDYSNGSDWVIAQKSIGGILSPDYDIPLNVQIEMKTSYCLVTSTYNFTRSPQRLRFDELYYWLHWRLVQEKNSKSQ